MVKTRSMSARLAKIDCGVRKAVKVKNLADKLLRDEYEGSDVWEQTSEVAQDFLNFAREAKDDTTLENLETAERYYISLKNSCSIFAWYHN